MFQLIFAAAALSAAGPSKPIVLDLPTRTDVRCLYALGAEMARTGQSDDASRRLDEDMYNYFTGRLEGRTPNLILAVAFDQEKKQMSQMSQVESERAWKVCMDIYGRHIDRIDAFDDAEKANGD